MMQKFGIEIRRPGTMPGLYKEVDNVLGNAGVTKSAVGDIVKVQAVAHSLQRMLKTENHFDVCTIDKCVEITQVYIPKERRDIYSSAHCMSWNEMLPEFRQILVAMVLDDFRTVLNYEE